MEVYLDNAATTGVYPEAAELMVKIMREDYGNPSSLHMKGLEAERHMRYARETFASLLKVKEKELIFTSGATESNNMALIGAALANSRRGKHIISSSVEHPSVLDTLKYLEGQGYEVDCLPVDRYGVVDISALKDAVRDDTIVISVMTVNNETGTIEPLEDLVRVVREKNKDCIIHTDAVQAFGKVPLLPARLGLDMMSISGHKFHGPKGTGLLWVREGVKLSPLIHGGGQQSGRRSGTENVPGCAAMAKAAELELKKMETEAGRLCELRSFFIDEILSIEGCRINGGIGPGSLSLPREGEESLCSAPHIVNVRFDDVRSEPLLHALEERGIYVSSGSACSSHHPRHSHVLEAMGVPGQFLGSALRFSFSYDTGKEEAEACIEALKEVLPMLRRFTRAGSSKRGKK